MKEKVAEIRELAAELDGTKMEADAQRERGDGLVKDQREKVAKIQELYNAQQKLEAKLQQAEQEFGKRGDDLAAAKEAYKNKEEELGAANQELGELEKKASAKERELEGTKERLRQVEEEVVAQKQKANQLERVTSKLEEEKKNAQQKLEAKLKHSEQESGKRGDDELGSIRKKYDKKKEEYDRQKKVVRHLQQLLTTLEGQKASLEKQLETTKREKEAVQKEKEEIEIDLAQKEEIKETLRVVQNKNEKWRKHVKELESRILEAAQQGQTAAAPQTPPSPTQAAAQLSPESSASVQSPESNGPAVPRRFTPPAARNFALQALRPELEALSPIWENQISTRESKGCPAPLERCFPKIQFSDMYCYQKGKKNKASEPGRANTYPCDDAMAVDRSTLVICDGVSQGGADSGKLARQVAQTIIRLAADVVNGDGEWGDGGSGAGGGVALSASPPHARTPLGFGSGQSCGLSRSQHLLLKASLEEDVQQVYHQAIAHGRSGQRGPSTTATVVSLDSCGSGFFVESTEVSIRERERAPIGEKSGRDGGWL